MEDPEIISSSKPIHVYISFRGDDSKTSRFVRDLSAALQRKGLITFGDDKKLEAIRDSNNIPPHLLQAIKQAWIRVVVFSKNYASSSWCLEELSSVVPRIHARMLRPAPAFHVNPFFAELEEKNWFEAYLDKVNTWRLAMNQEAHRSGHWYIPYRFISVFYDVDPETFAQQEETYT
ncbi:disease resistance protein RUN1-like [Prosopis cineraria]|uniref:disease resistance protein RUN1-like n=1 Tax=Prosopis cineraria TaxID=364024 RepID=UPI00240FC386|nr:disease resistance protein RUN1-like [Prosopis cineraria]